MFEFLREWVRPTAVKRQETMNAYLDGELSSQERIAFERFLADDEALQLKLADRETIKSQLGQLPRLAVPRNFILDVNKYGRPAKRPLSHTAYPILRGATALTAILFIFTLGLGMFSGGSADYSMAPQAEMAAEAVVETITEEMGVEETAVSSTDGEAPAPAERLPADGIITADELTDSSADDFDDNAANVANEAVEEEMIVEEEAAESEPEMEMEEDAEMPAAGASPIIAATKMITVTKTATATATIAPSPTTTAVPTITPIPTPPPQPELAPSPNLTNTQLIQIGLLVLLITLLTLTIYAKLRSAEVAK